MVINTKITLEWKHKQFVTRVYKLSDFLHDIRTHNDDENDDLHISTPSLTRPFYVLVDNVTIDFWWRHNYPTNLTRAREKWCLTRQISILFTSIFMTGRVRGTLKIKYCLFDNFVVTDAIVSCRNDNLRYHQWRQSYQIEDFLFSVNTTVGMIFTLMIK